MRYLEMNNLWKLKYINLILRMMTGGSGIRVKLARKNLQQVILFAYVKNTFTLDAIVDIFIWKTATDDGSLTNPQMLKQCSFYLQTPESKGFLKKNRGSKFDTNANGA